MSCCGQSSGQAQAKVAALIDEAVLRSGAGVGALVRLVYVGSDKRTQAFVVEGKVYQFGNNERRRVNAVPARVAPTFLRSRWPGLFVIYDPALHNEDGSRPEGTQSVAGTVGSGAVDSGAVGSGTVDTLKPASKKGAK